MGQAPPGETYNRDGEGTPFIQGCAEFGDRHPTPVKWCSATTAKRALPGDVLLSVRAPVGRINRALENLIVGRGVAAIRAKDGALTDYLEAALAHREPELQAVSAGSTFAAVTKKHVESLNIPLPSVEEQRRIADVLASVDAACEAAKLEATSSAELARRLRSRLVADPTVDRTRLGDVVQITMGRQRSPKHQTGDHLVPYLRAGNVKDGFLALGDVLRMNFTPVEQEKFRLKGGDVLVTEGCGSLSQIGANAVWHETVDEVVCFQNTLLRLRAIEGKTIAPFVAHWARYAFESGTFAAVSSGTNIFHIGAERAAEIPFPSLPLERQAEITRVLDQAEAVAQTAHRRLDALVALRGALLANLLSGSHGIPESYDRFLAEDTDTAAREPSV